MEGHGAQGGAAVVAGKAQHGLRVERIVAGLRDDLAGDGAGDVAGARARGQPFACRVTVNIAHVGSFSACRSLW